jgi:hypothetical protein
MQEETMTNPAKTPISAEGSSPIRQQIQGPIDSPEAIGSEKVVAMKPEMAISQETPSPIAPTNMPVDAANSPVGPMAAIPPVSSTPTTPAVNPVVAPTNIMPQSSPSVSSGITSPTSSNNNNNNSNTPAKTTSLSTTSLLPSQMKASGVGSKNDFIGPVQKSSQTNRSIAEAPQTFMGVNAGQSAFDKMIDALLKKLPGNFTQKLFPSWFQNIASDKISSNNA